MAFLVALPVAGMAMAVTLVRTGAVTPAQEWARNFGQADAVVLGDSTAALPPGSRSVTVERTSFRVLSAQGRRSFVDVSDAPVLDPMAAGIYDLVAGRPAAGVGEVALSTAMARRMGVTVGDELELTRPELRWRVVGLVEPVGCLSCTAALAAPGEVPQPNGLVPGQSVLVELPTISPTAQRQLSATGIQVRDLILAEQTSSKSGQGVAWSLVLGAVVLTVAGIVISAAFAVGARRQLVTLGQLSASGASPSTVRATLVLQGTITGLAGAAAGLVLWAGVLLGCRARIERLLNTRIDHFVIRPGEVLAATLIGVLAATIAALLPARTAAGIPVLSALAGRRPLAPLSRRQVTRGVFAFVGGLGLLGLAVLGSNSGSSPSTADSQVWALVAIAGGVAELLGACALAPVIVVRLEPLASRLRGALRLGARGLARHRARTGAVVSAVSAAGALAIAAGGFTLGAQALDRGEVRTPDDIVVVSRVTTSDAETRGETLDPVSGPLRRQLERVLPGSRVSLLRATTASQQFDPYSLWTVSAEGRSDLTFSSDRALVADPPVLRALRAGAAIRGALADNGVVVLTGGGRYDLVPGPVVVDIAGARSLPTRAVRHPYTLSYLSTILVTPERAAKLGLAVDEVGTIFTTPQALTEVARDGLEDLQSAQLPGESDGYASFSWWSPRGGPTPLQVELILTGLALVFSLFVVGASLALAAAESKDERDVLTIAGAPPGVLARAAAARAWLLAAIGGVMAIPIGFLPVMVFSTARSSSGGQDGLPIVFPSRTALLLLVAVPCIVALAALTASATAQRLRPVRVSTATFE